MKNFLFALMFISVCANAQVKISVTSPKSVNITLNLDSLENKSIVIGKEQSNLILNVVDNNDDEQAVDTADVVSEEEQTVTDTADVVFEEEQTVTDTTDIVSEEEQAVTDTADIVSEEEQAVTDTADTGNDGVTGDIATTAVNTGIAGNIFGITPINSLVDGFVGKNGEQYSEYDLGAMLQVIADTTKYTPQYEQRKWKWLKRHISYSTLELSGIFGSNFGGNADDTEIDEEDYGIDDKVGNNLGGSAKFSQVFVPGKFTEDGKFIPNRLNFAWSVGALFALDNNKDYGWSSELLGKIGIQAGNGITLGADALVGIGTTPYAIYSSDYVDYRVALHNQFCFKYGLQAWLSMNYGNNTYTSFFARIVRSVAPSSVYNYPTATGWYNELIDFDDGSWRVGFAVGYKFGYNADIRSKRLQASVSTGYNLFGGSKSAETFVELEKVNQVSPSTDFSYGVGFGISFGDKNLQSFVLTGGWLTKFNPASKFALLGKLHAGVGEYMIGKECISKDRHFDMSAEVRQLCAVGSADLGVAYKHKSSAFKLFLRGGYHYAFETSYEGFDDVIATNLHGFELTPFVGYSLVF